MCFAIFHILSQDTESDPAHSRSRFLVHTNLWPGWLKFNYRRWHVRKKTYDAVGQTQFGNVFASSFSQSTSHGHSADLLQAEGVICWQDKQASWALTLAQSTWQSDSNNTLNEQLTFIELKAEIRRRTPTGVVDGFLVQVIPGVNISSELHKKLNQVDVFVFGCVMKGCFV